MVVSQLLSETVRLKQFGVLHEVCTCVCNCILY